RRNAWKAVQQAQRYIRGGKRWVVDMEIWIWRSSST
ncbi:reverse transcriptase/maturase, partial [Escherichia coli]